MQVPQAIFGHSATESGFLSVIRQRPDTTFIGEPTAGSTGQPLVFIDRAMRSVSSAAGAAYSVRRGFIGANQ